MKKKIVSILACLLIIVPIQSVLGTTQSTGLMSNEDVVEQSVDADVVDMINQVNESLISGYLEGLVAFGPRYTGSENCSDAAEYIKEEFEELGLDAYIDPWKYPRYSCQNVVATFNGIDPTSDAVFIICAHYDTIGNSPGANDDGSGVAAMLAIANITSQYSFNHTIRFVAQSGEEEGCFGSLADAQRAYERDENIVAVLNIDMVGYANTTSDGKIIHTFAKERAKWISSFSNQIAQKYEEYIDLMILPYLNYPCDHQPYVDYGYDGVMYIQSKPEQYHWIDTPEDTLDKVNFTYLIKVTKLILATTAELANKPIDVQVRIVTPYEGYFYLFDHPILHLPGFNHLVHTGLCGMTYILGKAVVRVNVSTTEEIDGVLFGIDGDGDIWGVVRQPPYEWIIKRTMYSFFPLRGKHTLNVYVYTSSGKTAYDEMDIIVFPLR